MRVWSVEGDLYEDKDDAFAEAIKMVNTGVSTWAKNDMDRDIIKLLMHYGSREQVLHFFNLVGEKKNEREINRRITVSEVDIRSKRTK